MDYWMYKEYLMHYGTKGMKWGVRRNLGVLAREHARQANYQKLDLKRLTKLTAKGDRLDAKGKDTSKVYEKMLEGRDRVAARANYMKALSKDLYPADIDRGERAIKKIAFWGGLIGNSMSTASDSRKARKLTGTTPVRIEPIRPKRNTSPAFDESTRVTGEEEAEFWKALARTYTK